MKKISIDYDERWPDFYYEEDMRYGKEVEITDEEYEWLEKVFEEYTKAQWFLEERSDYDSQR